MQRIYMTVSAGLILTAMAAHSQTLSPSDQAAADAQRLAACQDEANRNQDECLLLPPVEEATNFAFALAPLFPVAATLGLVAAATGNGTSTPSTSP